MAIHGSSMAQAAAATTLWMLLFLAMPALRHALSTQYTGGFAQQAVRSADTMAASVVRSGNPNPCPGMTGDKGVHAATKTVRKHCSANLGRIVEMQVPKPKPTRGQVLVRVAYSSVNPCNWKSILSNTAPLISGSEFAGTVEEAVAPCAFKAGDQVWGMGGACFAEYLVTGCEQTGLKPASLSMQEAAVLPLVSLTCLQGLRYAGAPWKSSPTVLVIGGSSGTGSVGIQLAKAAGAGKVISTCSEQNFDAVRGFGADQVIDYHKQNWWEVLAKGSVDIIYDCVCLERTGNHAYDILPDGGYFLTIQQGSMASPLVAMRRPKVKQYGYLLNEITTGRLDYLKGVAEEGKLKTPIDSTFGLADVGLAFNQSMEGHTVGKISIRVA